MEVHEVIKYTQNHCVCHNSINSEHMIISQMQVVVLCDKATSSSTPAVWQAVNPAGIQMKYC